MSRNTSLYDSLFELKVKAMFQRDNSYYLIRYYKDELKHPSKSIKLKREKTKYREAQTVLNGIESTIKFLSQVEFTKNQ